MQCPLPFHAAGGVELYQQVFEGQLRPRMVGAYRFQRCPKALHRFGVERIEGKLLEHQGVERCRAGIAHHGQHLFGRAVVVALPVAPIGAALAIFPHIDRPQLTRGPGHSDADVAQPVNLFDNGIAAREKIRAHFRGIVDAVPELLEQSVGISQSLYVERTSEIFLHAEENNAALGICEGRIGFP